MCVSVGGGGVGWGGVGWGGLATRGPRRHLPIFCSECTPKDDAAGWSYIWTSLAKLRARADATTDGIAALRIGTM